MVAQIALLMSVMATGIGDEKIATYTVFNMEAGHVLLRHGLGLAVVFFHSPNN